MKKKDEIILKNKNKTSIAVQGTNLKLMISTWWTIKTIDDEGMFTYNGNGQTDYRDHKNIWMVVNVLINKMLNFYVDLGYVTII